MYASEARQQQAGAPANVGRPYPSTFGNRESLALSTPGSQSRSGRTEWLHHPLTPGTTTTWTASSGTGVGAVRSIYTAGDPNKFDVAHHDPSVGVSARGFGNFGTSNYHGRAPPPPARGSTTKSKSSKFPGP